MLMFRYDKGRNMLKCLGVRQNDGSLLLYLTARVTDSKGTFPTPSPTPDPSFQNFGLRLFPKFRLLNIR